MSKAIRLVCIGVLVCLLVPTLDVSGQSLQRRRRVFGGLPDWAKNAWMFRRQVDDLWALVGGNVVDVLTGTVQENVTVIIKGDLIERVSSAKPPKGMKTVDATGRFIIPGLFDLHAHVMPQSLLFPGSKPPEETLRVLLESGVTTIRLLPLISETSAGWSARINDGELAGPTIVSCSAVFEKTPQRTSKGFGDPETARRWVLKEALLGSRWIKVYNKMDAASLKAIVEEASKHGMRVCGHTEDVPPGEASAIGMHCIEHMVSIPLSCMKSDTEPRSFNDLGSQTAWRWDHVDETALTALLKTFKNNGTAWVPTLVVTERIIKGGGHDGKGFAEKGVADRLARALRRSARAAVELHRMGGLVGLGTDFPIDGVEPGVSAYRELELLVEYGGALPLEALQIGTIGSARILGFEPILGTVEPNMIANLIVLDKNPLEDISNVSSVWLVVHDGRPIGGNPSDQP